MVMVPARTVAVLIGTSALASLVFTLVSADDRVPAVSAVDGRASPSATRKPLESRKAAPHARLPPVDPFAALARARLEDGRMVATDELGRRIVLSVVPQLQGRAAHLLAEYQVPYGALVAIEPSTGRMLAYVSHSSANPDAPDLVRDPTPPAASVFKLITSAALIEANVGPDTRVCYGGGLSRLLLNDLLDDPRRDQRCATLEDALGGSINAVFAKLADRHLDPASLRRYATAFGFGQPLPFEADCAPSPAEVPDERLEFARTAAGFWHVHMSPLHAALIAATLANDGVMPYATLVDSVLDANGQPEAPSPRPAARSVLSAATARSVSHMMLRTVHDGTAHSAFYDTRGRPLLPGVVVAGKTGSLNADNPFRAYSWWVGFAPADKPRIALAALIVNTPAWRIKSSFLAREALHEYFAALSAATPAAPRVAPDTRM